MASEKTFDLETAARAQAEYCRASDLPLFAPADERCWGCGSNIYVPKQNYSPWHGVWTSGVSVEQASRELVVKCPHCNRSYCD